MYAYPLYRLNRSVAAVIMAAAAVIGALMAPITLMQTTGVAVPAASDAVPTSVSQADPAARAIAAQQHVTLAQAETRLSWQQAVPSLNAALSRGLPAATLGGTWIASNNGDRVEVGLIGLNPNIRAIVMRAVRAAGLSAAADIVRVRYSAGQLVRADAWVSGQLIKLYGNQNGTIHLDVGYRMDLNRVQLGVAGHYLTRAERALITNAKARYGDLVQVVAQPAGSATGTSLDCNQQFDYCLPPLRAGINIFRLNSQGQSAPGQCTAGFIASSRTDGKLYEFTAGHCAAEAGTGTWGTYFPPPNPTVHAIGTVHNYIYNSSGDEAILNINNPSGWGLPQGWVYVQSGPNTTLNERYPITSAHYSTQGARVCFTGASSGTSCGTVAALGVTHCESPNGLPPYTCVTNLGEATFSAQPGDSGSPVYASNQAFGLVISNGYDVYHGGEVAFYQGIIGAENAMNVNIVLAH